MHTLINKRMSLVKFLCMESSSLSNPYVLMPCLDILSWEFSLGFLLQGDHLSVFCLLGLCIWFVLESRVSSCLLFKRNLAVHTRPMVGRGFPGGSVEKKKKSICHAGDAGSTPGLGRSPEGGHGDPLQYPCLENPMERAAQCATVHGGPKESDMPEVPEHARTKHIAT